MSARIPTGRLGQSGLAAFCPRSSYIPTRSFSCALRLKDEAPKQENNLKPLTLKEKIDKAPGPTPDNPLSNPVLEQYLAHHDVSKKPSRPEPRLGAVSQSPSSLFQPEVEVPGWYEGITPEELQALQEQEKQRERILAREREHELHALKLDPAPAARLKFEKKMAIKDVLKNGRVTKAIKLARTERESTYQSPFLPTSVKKLTRIMHLIAGKTVEEALIQLRFSPKRIARDVRKGLMIARDEAIAKRGMGLGGAQATLDALEARKAREVELDALEAEYPALEEDDIDEEGFEPYLADGTRRQERPNKDKGTLIELKNGSRKRVLDETEMYIDQAWVGRGEKGVSPEFRARGRVNMLTHRTAMFTILLKEEKTRIRISQEMQKKRENRKLWLPLPDRPVTSQRQYCLW
ncbi:ribosomal protein L22 [Byssothecium circinans]|uniref:Ribosomal protein L22 n=1 Tax=Byssothecium circinans TaxID=147558 RepID=A0A6A5T8K7_9PLEO|nr:ribosomal protein L22 [Byssothecium circinans]